MKKIFTAIIASLALVTLVGCGSKSSSGEGDKSLQKIKDKGELVVALSPDYAPFEFQMIKDGKNVVVGSDVDLANKIAEKIGVKVKIDTMDFSNVLASVSSGKADMAISGLTATSERRKAFDFSDEYYKTKNIVVIKKSNSDKYKTIADFKGAKVSAQKGSIQEDIVKNEIKDASLVSLPKSGAMINELKNGTVDAVVLDNMVAESYVAANSDLEVIKDITFKSDDEESNAIAMTKGSKTLQEEVNKIIADLKKDDSLNKSVKDNYDLAKEAKQVE
ncbi:amino acid ABC transporter substrate-binding protein [Floricoccus tropicus]|uniref:Amino acid ABC transporter substrate-binding protein n=1 Tax=Floricoccus tropicus TaxID=1859473 RepID=A0A1E8GND6_9LACT|nr:transporter substrate-binding domain-containing protein [Floricoccus tropicus]OFI49677.1 amino acid ABC transporter substrate-binding protein [Floricoccus tropicus]